MAGTITYKTLMAKIAAGQVSIARVEQAYEMEKRAAEFVWMPTLGVSMGTRERDAIRQIEKERPVHKANAQVLERILVELGYLKRKCIVCGRRATMTASQGPTCPDHYDEASD